MADDPPPSLIPIRDSAGNVTGVMDQATADYLASTRPEPTQASLDELLRPVTRVRVVPFNNFVRGQQSVVLTDTTDAASLARFRGCFAIVEDPATFGHCMCGGDPHIELFVGDALVGTIGYHHGYSIRWAGWKSDAWLREPDRLLDWMTAHGVPGPRASVEEDERRAARQARAAEKWTAAMPECLRPFWDRMDNTHDPDFHCELRAALAGSIPDPAKQVRSLFVWYSHGDGPWSGYPSYEGIPEQLLHYFPTEMLIEVLTREPAIVPLQLGGARYFVLIGTRRQRGLKAAPLPLELVRRLLAVTRSAGNDENTNWMVRIFGDS